MSHRQASLLSLVVAWVALIATVSMAGWFWFGEQPYLSYPRLPFPVLDFADVDEQGEPVVRRGVVRKVKRGQIAHLLVDRCNSDDVERSYLTGRMLVPLDVPSRLPYVLETRAAPARPGCEQVVSKLNSIPKDAVPGLYYISGTAEVNGSIRTFVVTWHSEPFEVIE